MTKAEKTLLTVVAWEELGDYELGLDAQGKWTGWQRVKHLSLPCWNYDLGIKICRDGSIKHRNRTVVRLMSECRQGLSTSLRRVISLTRRCA